MPRTFNGSTDKLVVALGALGVFGPGTMVAVIKKASDSTTIKVPFCVGGTTDATSYYFYLDNGTSNKFGFWNGAADTTNLTGFLAASDGWALVAVTKATGTSTARAHKYIYGTDTHTHTDMSAVANSATPATSASFGAQVNVGTFNPFPGDIAMAAVYDIAMTDAQIEELAFSLPAWWQSQPKGLWLFDQSATGQNVPDLSGGGANQSSLTGTTVSTSSVPVFSYGAPLIATRQPSVGGTTYAKDSTFLTGTALVLPDVIEHAHTATLLAGTKLTNARAIDRPRAGTFLAGSNLTAPKTADKPRASTFTAGSGFIAADVFTATETAAFTATTRLVADDVYASTETATFTATTRAIAADTFTATETATFVAGTVLAPASQAGFAARAASFIAGTIATAARALTRARSSTATAGTNLTAADAATLNRTATAVARAQLVGDDIFIATETAFFRAGTVATGVSQKTVASVSAKTATFTAGTRLSPARSSDTAAPIGHIDGISAGTGVDGSANLTGIEGTTGLAGVIG